jgi:hypothetical protein
MKSCICYKHVFGFKLRSAALVSSNVPVNSNTGKYSDARFLNCILYYAFSLLLPLPQYEILFIVYSIFCIFFATPHSCSTRFFYCILYYVFSSLLPIPAVQFILLSSMSCIFFAPNSRSTTFITCILYYAFSLLIPIPAVR